MTSAAGAHDQHACALTLTITDWRPHTMALVLDLTCALRAGQIGATRAYQRLIRDCRSCWPAWVTLPSPLGAFRNTWQVTASACTCSLLQLRSGVAHALPSACTAVSLCARLLAFWRRRPKNRRRVFKGRWRCTRRHWDGCSAADCQCGNCDGTCC